MLANDSCERKEANDARVEKEKASLPCLVSLACSREKSALRAHPKSQVASGTLENVGQREKNLNKHQIIEHPQILDIILETIFFQTILRYTVARATSPRRFETSVRCSTGRRVRLNAPASPSLAPRFAPCPRWRRGRRRRP